jgi:hypothetical protein
MLVFVPTRDDVLAIRSIEDAFDLWTPKVTRREVALIRIAAAEGLLEVSGHTRHAADDEFIAIAAVINVVRFGKPASKDVDPHGLREVGINFEGNIRSGRRIRVKVSWDRRHYTATVHTI